MDKLSKLKSLLGDNHVSSGEEAVWKHIKSKYVYEGTDSEDDDEAIMSGRTALISLDPTPATAVNSTRVEALASKSATTTSNRYLLNLGDAAPEGESFCPWPVVRKYPFSYIGVKNLKVIAEDYFDQGKLFNRPWDFFYIHRGSASNLPAILLVPTSQFQDLLDDINSTVYDCELKIPSGGAKQVFQLTFVNDGNPRPRYLGHSTNKDMAEDLRTAIPPAWHKAAGEGTTSPSDRSLEAFKAKIDLMTQAAKGKKVVNKEKQKGERAARQQGWRHSTKRVQRYLGLRQASEPAAPPKAEWGTFITPAFKDGLPRSADFSPDVPAPYIQEGDVVFVCIDVEANERNSSQITEIGIATLDTRDLETAIPGERGANWNSKIRARHLRIDEYKHIINSEFVTGCPGRFEFGESEFIKLKDAPQHVASCFKPPFSNPYENVVVDENEPKRNIVMVGHGLGADITYLRNLGYDIYNLSNLQELVDTSTMYQVLKRDTNPRNLGSVLADLDITGWNLHNAGNDAVYTLQAMIGISVKQLYERGKHKEDKELEKKARVEETIKEATQNALDREDGWSSGGNDSDGGASIAPVPSGTKKPTMSQVRKGAQYTEGPWRNPVLNAGNSQVSQRGGHWQANTSTSSNHPSTSNGSWRGRGGSPRGSSRGGLASTSSSRFPEPDPEDAVALAMSQAW